MSMKLKFLSCLSALSVLAASLAGTGFMLASSAAYTDTFLKPDAVENVDYFKDDFVASSDGSGAVAYDPKCIKEDLSGDGYINGQPAHTYVDGDTSRMWMSVWGGTLTYQFDKAFTAVRLRGITSGAEDALATKKVELSWSATQDGTYTKMTNTTFNNLGKANEKAWETVDVIATDVPAEARFLKITFPKTISNDSEFWRMSFGSLTVKYAVDDTPEKEYFLDEFEDGSFGKAKQAEGATWSVNVPDTYHQYIGGDESLMYTSSSTGATAIYEFENSFTTVCLRGATPMNTADPLTENKIQFAWSATENGEYQNVAATVTKVGQVSADTFSTVDVTAEGFPAEARYLKVTVPTWSGEDWWMSLGSLKVTYGVTPSALDKTELDTSKAEAGGKQKDDYTTDSWAAFTAALETANELPETTQEEIDAKTAAIKAAIALLEDAVLTLPAYEEKFIAPWTTEGVDYFKDDFTDGSFGKAMTVPEHTNPVSDADANHVYADGDKTRMFISEAYGATAVYRFDSSVSALSLRGVDMGGDNPLQTGKITFAWAAEENGVYTELTADFHELGKASAYATVEATVNNIPTEARYLKIVVPTWNSENWRMSLGSLTVKYAGIYKDEFVNGGLDQIKAEGHSCVGLEKLGPSAEGTHTYVDGDQSRIWIEPQGGEILYYFEEGIAAARLRGINGYEDNPLKLGTIKFSWSETKDGAYTDANMTFAALGKAENAYDTMDAISADFPANAKYLKIQIPAWKFERWRMSFGSLTVRTRNAYKSSETITEATCPEGMEPFEFVDEFAGGTFKYAETVEGATYPQELHHAYEPMDYSQMVVDNAEGAEAVYYFENGFTKVVLKGAHMWGTAPLYNKTIKLRWAASAAGPWTTIPYTVSMPYYEDGQTEVYTELISGAKTIPAEAKHLKIEVPTWEIGEDGGNWRMSLGSLTVSTFANPSTVNPNENEARELTDVATGISISAKMPEGITLEVTKDWDEEVNAGFAEFVRKNAAYKEFICSYDLVTTREGDMYTITGSMIDVTIPLEKNGLTASEYAVVYYDMNTESYQVIEPVVSDGALTFTVEALNTFGVVTTAGATQPNKEDGDIPETGAAFSLAALLLAAGSAGTLGVVRRKRKK